MKGAIIKDPFTSQLLTAFFLTYIKEVFLTYLCSSFKYLYNSLGNLLEVIRVQKPSTTGLSFHLKSYTLFSSVVRIGMYRTWYVFTTTVVMYFVPFPFSLRVINSLFFYYSRVYNLYLKSCYVKT